MFAPVFSNVGGNLTLDTVGLDGTMISWDVSGSRSLGEPFHAGAGTNSLHIPAEDKPHIAASPDGRLLATNDVNGISIIDAATHATVRTIKPAVPNGSFDVAWSPDGTRLAVTGSGAEMVDLYDTATWQLVSPDGGPLAGPFADRPASSDEIDPNDPTETGRRLNVASAVAFSPDSARVVAGADDGTVWTWDARTGAPVGLPLQLDGPVLDVAIDRISNALAVAYGSAGGGGRVSVYGPGESTARYTVNVDDGYGRPEAVTFSPDGSTLATGGGTGDIRFWDATTGLEISPRVLASAGWVLDLAWTPLGRDAGQRRYGRDRSTHRRGDQDRRRCPARAREPVGGRDAVVGRLPPVRRVRERAGLRLVDRPRRLGSGRMQHRRSHPDAGGMVPVPAESPVRPRLHPVTR